MKTVFTIGAIATAMLIQTAPAYSANPMLCGERTKIVERLTTHYGETRRGMGLGSNNGIMEVYASDSTGTWTIAMTLPDGRMCLMASGQSFEDQMDPLSVAGSDA